MQIGVITPNIRELILKRSMMKEYIDYALSGIDEDKLLEMICCQDIPLETLR